MNMKRKATLISLVAIMVLSLAAFSLSFFGLNEANAADGAESVMPSATVTVVDGSGAEVTANHTRGGVKYYIYGTEIAAYKLKVSFGAFAEGASATVTYGGTNYTANSANSTVEMPFVGGACKIAYKNGETPAGTNALSDVVLLKGVDGFYTEGSEPAGLYYAMGGEWAETTVTTDGSEVSCFGSPVGAEADFDLYAFGYYGALGVEAAVSGGAGENFKVYLNGALDTDCTLRSDLDNTTFNQNSGTTINRWTAPTTVRLSNEKFNKITFGMTATDGANAFVRNLVAIPGFNQEEIAPATLKIGDSEEAVTVTKNGTVACDFVGKSVTITAPDNTQSYVSEEVYSLGGATTLYVNGTQYDDGGNGTWAFDDLKNNTVIRVEYADSLFCSFAAGEYECEIFYEYTFTLKTPETLVSYNGKTLSEAALYEQDGTYYIVKNEDETKNNFKVSFIGTLKENTSAKITYGENTVTVNGDSSVQNDVTLENYAGGNVTVEYFNEAGESASTEVYKIVLVKSLGVEGLYYSNDNTYPWSFVYNEDGSLNYMHSYVNPETNKFGVGNGVSEISVYVLGYKHLGYSFAQSSEYNWDYLYTYVNGKETKKLAGVGSNTKNIEELEWHEDVASFENDGFNIVTFTYKKDFSGDNGLDRVFVKDFKNVFDFDVSNIGKLKVEKDINGVVTEAEVENGDSIELTFGEDATLNFYAPALKQGEECYVCVDGVKVDSPLLEVEGFYVYRLENIMKPISVEFVYQKEGYADFVYSINVDFIVNGSLQENLVVDGDVKVDNTRYEYPFVFAPELSETGRISYKTTNKDKNKTSSGIAFTVKETGIISFDYYISSYLNRDIVYYNTSDTIMTYDNKGSQIILTENTATSSGDRGWNSISIPVSVTNEPITIHVAYVKDTVNSNWYDDLFAIANVRYLAGKTTVKAEISNAEGGSVTITSNDQTIENGSVLAKGTKVTFSATTNDCYTFYAWKNLVTGELVCEQSITVVLIDDEVSYQAIIEPVGTFAVKGSYNFYKTLSEAFADGREKTVFVIKDLTVTENLTIPDGVTVILPYAADDTTGYKQGGTTTRVSWNAGILPYVTLTVNNGVTLTVNGKLIVGGVQHGSDQNATGRTCGNYAKLVNNGNLVINGKMDVRGLVTGDGTLTVNGGAELKQPFMVNNYAGGTNTQALYDAGQFPFVQFATVNVQCKQVINYGAKVIGSTSLYALHSINTQDLNLVYPKGGSSDGSLIWMEEGSRLEITYNNKTVNNTVGNIHLGDSGVCTIAVYGNITAGGFALKVGFATYGSTGMVLSIPYTYNFELKSGSKVTLAHKYKIMPGAVVTVEQGAELDITADGGLYVYDGLIQADKSGKSYPSASILGEHGFDKSGMLVVNGKLTIDGIFAGIVQTSGNGEIAVASGATVGEQTITDGCEDGYDSNSKNKTVFRMTGRVYGLNGFMSLQPGKTYKAYGDKEFTLASFTVDEAARMSELTVTLNQKMTGRFLEFDGENFVSEVEFAVNLENGKTIYINGAAYVVSGGKVTVEIAFGADGKFTYYTGEFETSSAAHEGVIALDGATELTKAVTGVALSETNVYEIAEGGSFALKAVITYADNSREEVALATPNFTTYVLKNASLTNEKLAVSFTKDLAVVKTVLSDYISSVEALDNNQDDVVGAAKNCYAAYTSLIGGLNADDLEFVTAKIGDKQAYASEIAKEMSVEDYSFTYGDDGASVTLTMIDGTKKSAMAGIFECFLTDKGVAADIEYHGKFESASYSLRFNRQILGNRLELSVSWTVGNYTYNGTEHKPEATLSGVLAKDNGKVSVVVTGAVNAGEQTAIATLTGEKAGYYAIKTADSTKKFTIEKASANVKVNDKAGVTTSFTAIEFEVTESGLIDGDSLTYSFKIFYNGELIATANASGVLTFEDGKTLTPGIYTVEAFAENANYNIAFENGSLTVEATDNYYIVSFVGEGKATFTGGVFNPEVKAIVDETKEEETNIIVSHGEIINAGVYEITVKVGALGKVYKLQFVVEAKPIELDWNVSGLVYNGSAQKPSAEAKQGEIVDGNIVTVNVSTASSAINAGTYTATATLGGENAGNYVITNATAEFAITPASVEVTIEEATSVYGENAANIRLNTTSELYGKKLSDIVEAVCEVTSSSAVGTYEITLNEKDENYAITYEKGRYLVTKRAITVTIDNKTSAYGEAFTELTAKVTSGSIVNGDENVFTLAKESGATVGEYAIYVNESLNNANYEITVTNGVYTITKRNITVKVNNSESVYGDEFEALTSDITSGSLAEGDELNGVVRLAKASGEEVGVYAITAEIVNANYNVTFVYTAGDHSVYEITKREVVLTIKDGEFSYTEDIADMKLEIAVKNGYSLKGGETLEDLNLAYTIKQNGVLLTNKTLRGGEWKFEVTFDNGNYSITFENADDENLAYGILTITKPVLELADLTAEHTYSGEAFGYYDYESAVTVKANSTADDFGCELYFNGEKVSEMKNAGTYTVRVILKSAVAFALKDGTDGNNYKDFTVIVHKKDVTNEIAFVCDGSVATENGIYVPLGNYTSIGVSLKDTDIGYAEYLTFGGAESELAELGEYKYKVTVNDDNYSGEKEFTLVAVMSIEVKSSNLKKYTAEYNENRTNANADKVRDLLAKLTDSDRILFTHEKHAGIYSAAAQVESLHVEYLKNTLTEKIEAFGEKQSYDSILEARKVALDLKAFKAGEGEEQIAAYEAVWNEYCENLTSEGAAASGIADYMSLAAAVTVAAAAMAVAMKKFVL